MVDRAIEQLLTYALRKGLIQPCEEHWAANALLEVLEPFAGEVTEKLGGRHV